MVIRATVINRITRTGDIGESGYSVYGEDVICCSRSGSHDTWHGATQDALYYAMPSSCYITRAVYEFLTISERDEIRSRVIAVCENDCIHRIDNPFYGGGQCWALNESKIITDFPYPHDPCDGVVCDDLCDNTNLYETICEAGICVRGRLIEEDSQICGYVPPEPEPPEPEPPEPDPETIPWDMIILMIVVVVLFYFLATRG